MTDSLAESKAIAGARIFFAAALLCVTACHAHHTLTVGSKKFTESVIIGEITTRLIANAGVNVRHQAELGGTRILWDALRAGQIDLYPEYTGTLCQEVLHSACDMASLRQELAKQGVRMTDSLGFRDGYALAVRPEVAQRLHLSRISELAAHPELHFGFSDEFISRGDGWNALRKKYNLPAVDARGLDHDLAWRGLHAGDLDIIDAYTTDAEIAYYQPRLLIDDLHHFADYDAVLLFRDDLAETAQRAIAPLAGALTTADMIAMNARAKRDKAPDAIVAGDWLTAHFSFGAAQRDSLLTRLAKRTREHLALVGTALFFAILFGVPLGIVAARRRKLGQLIVAATGLLQTVPSLALLVFMIPLFGIGTLPALVALGAYSLLPIVRNTLVGLTSLPPPLRDSAIAIGLSDWDRLRLVELPLAMPSILAGVQTAAVIAVGTATIGALIGAGGYGQPILTGVRLDDTRLILEGAIPAAVLALLVQGGFELLRPLVISRGLRPSL